MVGPDHRRHQHHRQRPANVALRLETQGLLTSQWREEGKRNKRFYRLSPDGERVLAQLLAEWNSISDSILRLSDGDR